MPVFRMDGNKPDDKNVLKNLASIGEIILDILLSTLIGISLALSGDIAWIISMISSDEHSLRKMEESTEFFT